MTVIALIFIASFIQSLAGFGFGMVFVPLALFILEPEYAISLSVLCGSILNMLLLIPYAKYVNIKKASLLLFGGLITTPFGAKLLSELNTASIKLSLALLMIFTSIAMYKNLKVLIAKENTAYFLVGCMSGLLGALFGVGAPPIVLFLVNQNTKKEAFKATLVLYFSFINFYILYFYYKANLLTGAIVNQFYDLLAPSLLAYFIGRFISKKISEEHFKNLTLLIVFTSATLLLLRSI